MKVAGSWTLVSLLALAIVSIGIAHAAQQLGQSIQINEKVTEDLYAAGQSIQVSAMVDGDVTAAAQRITIDDTVNGDANVAAEIIMINAEITDDLRAAGRSITLSAPVGDHIVAAGENITLSSRASTQGWAKLAGRQIDIQGRIANGLHAAAQQVIIAGRIDGDVHITADSIIIQSSANISGRLIYRSHHEADIRPGANIAGGVEHLPMPATEHAAEWAVKAVAGILVVFGLALLLTGIVYILLFPYFSLAGARTISDQALQSLGLGVAVIVVIPLIIVLLLMSVFGYLLALCLLAGYLVLLVAGILTGMMYFADLALRRLFKQEQASTGKRILAFIVTALILLVVILIPLLGGLLLLFLLFAGNGAIYLQLWRRYSTA